jgi:hypothetical protein
MRIEPWRARADLAVGAGSGDDLLISERARRVAAQAHRRRGLGELRAFGPDVKLASRQLSREMSGTSPPLALATSRAALIWTGALSRP